MAVDLRRSLSAPSLGVMTFLNEIVQRYPAAISFAPGRPREEFFNVGEVMYGMWRWVDYRASSTGRAKEQVTADLGQYGDTAGIIRELIARHLAVDLSIAASESSIVVTTGCQEAMLISLLTLLDPATDTLLASDPAYIGITGMASIAGIPVRPVPTGRDGLTVSAVETAVRAERAAGRTPRALYDVPDFNNPLGSCMPLAARRELLAFAEEADLIILEDNPYGAFAYDHAPMPTLKALDTKRVVVYLGSFAKTLFPGLRIGYIVAGQDVAGSSRSLAAYLTDVKSFTTVNTSPISQAMVGGALLTDSGSLAAVVNARVPSYRAARDRMLTALSTNFSAVHRDAVWWNRPGGGFFLVVSLPFAFTDAHLERCASDFGVIVTPMRYFSLSGGRECEVRLSFSYVNGQQIDEGIARLAAFVSSEMGLAEP